MSPQRRKWRGGAGGKTIAPLPSSSSSLVPSPFPQTHIIPTKLSSDRRHAIATLPIVVSEASALKPKPQLPHSSRFPSSLDRIKTVKNVVITAEKSSIAKPLPESRLKARASSAVRTRNTEEEKSRASSETGLRAPKPRSVSAVKPRPDVSDQASRASSGSSLIRAASLASNNSSSSGVSKRESVPRSRAESRPRSGRASFPSIVRKEDPQGQTSMGGRDKQISQRQVREEETVPSDARQNARATIIREEEGQGKRASTIPTVSSKLDNTVTKLTTKAPRASMPQKENQVERWSTSVLPIALPVQTNRKSSLAEGNPRTKGKQYLPPVIVEGKCSSGSSAISHSTRKYSKPTSEDDINISSNSYAISSFRRSFDNDSQMQGQYSITSTAKFASLQGILSENETSYSSQPTASMPMERYGVKDDGSMSSSLHRRLAHLEGKVNQIAAELRRTRSLLDSDDCAVSVSVLCDIQDTISTIERTMVSADRDEIASLEDVIMEDEFPTVVRNSEEPANMLNLYFTEAGVTSKAPPLQGSISAPARFSQLNRGDQQELEDHLLPHGKLLKSRLSLSNVETNSKPTLYAEKEDAPNHAHLERLGPTSLGDMGFTIADNVKNASSVRSSAHLLTSIRSEENKQLEADTWSSRSSESHLAPQCVEDSKCDLECDETLPFDSLHEDAENVVPDDGVEFEYVDDEILPNELHPIGDKVAVAGWYASEGDAILLAHDDGSCSYHDVANMEEKAVFDSPDDMALPVWNDCWLIRAAGSDGHSNKYVVAMTAGNATDCGFCSWDFYDKTLSACHFEDQRSLQRFALARGSKIRKSLSSDSPSRSTLTLPLPGSNTSCIGTDCDESPQWWYNPSGALLASVANAMKRVALYDIRDGDLVMEWDTNTGIASLDYCYPVQWRDRGKLVLAEQEAISIWDVNTMDVNCLQFIELPGKKISALHVHNSDAECSGGVRQRLSSSETEAFDGICCTQDDINVLDFRVPNGVGISFPNPEQIAQCVFARQDMVLIGGLDRVQNQCSLQQWSVRKGMQVCTYAFATSSSHYTSHHLSLSQVWGSSSMVMAVNGNGLSIFKTCKESDVEEVKDMIGPQDLCNASFDYSNSRVLLISRDRPARWSYW